MKDRRPDPPKVWQYELAGGYCVLAGRTDADNDQLSLRVAKANDYWFHVKGMPGSHVVLQVGDESPDRDVLKQAAAIAAYHSKARGGGVVAVTYTLGKHVSKARGAKPGTVSIKREQTLKVRPAVPEGHSE